MRNLTFGFVKYRTLQAVRNALSCSEPLYLNNSMLQIKPRTNPMGKVCGNSSIEESNSANSKSKLNGALLKNNVEELPKTTQKARESGNQDISGIQKSHSTESQPKSQSGAQEKETRYHDHQTTKVLRVDGIPGGWGANFLYAIFCNYGPVDSTFIYDDKDEFGTRQGLVQIDDAAARILCHEIKQVFVHQYCLLIHASDLSSIAEVYRYSSMEKGKICNGIDSVDQLDMIPYPYPYPPPPQLKPDSPSSSLSARLPLLPPMAFPPLPFLPLSSPLMGSLPTHYGVPCALSLPEKVLELGPASQDRSGMYPVVGTNLVTSSDSVPMSPAVPPPVITTASEESSAPALAPEPNPPPTAPNALESLAVSTKKENLGRSLRVRTQSDRQIFVKNLDRSLIQNDNDFRLLFCIYGEIEQCTLCQYPNGDSRGFGFVKFEKCEDAVQALESMNRKTIGEGTLFVKFAVVY